MDFFAHQDRARRHTTLMVVLFLASVACIVAAINFVGAVIYIYVADVTPYPFRAALAAVPSKAYWITSAVVLAIIAFGTLSRLAELSGGGAALARLVGARRVEHGSAHPGERRLLNVVEEMAIASGINVPQVFVMEDQGNINAFAAGYSPNEAAITVTRGALERLNRDELQGVVGHEFSHILNGDMRLNIRLMGVISGIVVIAALGRFAMDVGGGGWSRRDREESGWSIGGSGSSGRSRGDMRIFALGLAIWLIGCIGELFGTLIKAAISRQREFLADASAVQFTRNPGGISAALYKISQTSSAVHQRHSEELSHMYFCEPVSHMVFATHPPLEHRIERIMGSGAIPILKDRFKRARVAEQSAAAAAAPNPVVDALRSPLPAGAAGLAVAPAAADGFAAGSDMPHSRTSPAVPDPVVDAFRSPLFAPAAAGRPMAVTPAQVVASIGTLSSAHAEHARKLLSGLPASVREAIAAEHGARAALFALLLGEGEVRARQLEAISGEAGPRIAEQTAQIADAIRPLGVRVRLPVFELAVPALAGLSVPQREAALGLVNTLIQADGKLTLGEFVLLTLCRRHLEKPARGAPPIKHKTLHSAARETEIVLALLARASPEGEAAFGRVMASLDLNAATERKIPSFTLAMVETALYELKLLAPLKKPALIKACLEIVMANGSITVTEGELMRAICATLDSPLPPLLENSSGWQDRAQAQAAA